MKVVIAPDSFKESLSARDVAKSIVAGFREGFPEAECIELPLADGGEGTVDALTAATGGRQVPVEATGPLGAPVKASYGILGDGRTAVIELAAASGLMLVPPENRNPLATTTYGTGELIRAALDAGVSRIVVGIGGSATNDGGAGMLQALGVKLLDRDGREIGFGGGALEGLVRIDCGGLDPRLGSVALEVACDVDNPLIGDRGASAVFGPQKGATPAMIARLDDNLRHYAGIIHRDLGKDVPAAPGAGAAGGTGAALLAVGATLRPGIDLVLDALNFAEVIRDADLVITGEGRMDGQSLAGKVPVGVARLAARLGKPVIAIVGSYDMDGGTLASVGIDAVFSAVSGPCALEDALANAAANVRQVARNVAAVLSVSCPRPHG